MKTTSKKSFRDIPSFWYLRAALLVFIVSIHWPDVIEGLLWATGTLIFWLVFDEIFKKK